MEKNSRLRTLLHSPMLPILGSILSGLLLALAFPGFGKASLAFVGLVPLMFAVQSATPKKAAGLGLLAGFVFFMVSLGWLHNLVHMVSGIGLKASALLGYAVLALYCALYFVPFALVVSACARRWGLESLRTNLRLMFSATVVWVAAEYLRGQLFTGFPWNPLGVSQYDSPAMIQVAAWGGVSIVSAYIVWMNAALFVTIRQYALGLRTRRYRPHVELMLGLLPIALAAAYGFNALVNRPPRWKPLTLALVQPNIPQSDKWDAEKDEMIRARLGELTETATRLDGIDLAIWPETALPDFARVSRSSMRLVRRATAAGVPLLAGSMDVAFLPDGKRLYFNSSLLFDTNGTIVAKYDKQHLVPFGEYVPFPKLLGGFTPVDVDFRAGTRATLLSLDNKPPFSALICFEDTVAPLAIRAVRNGARWLVNQSNDAWFDPSAQSEQHLAHAVFRCVENRVPMARCCNSGVTCIIDAYGAVTRGIAPRTEGIFVGQIYPRPIGLRATFYTRNGDAFAKVCLLAAATIAFVLRFRGWRRKR